MFHSFNKYLLNVYYVPETSRIGNMSEQNRQIHRVYMQWENTSSNREASQMVIALWRTMKPESKHQTVRVANGSSERDSKKVIFNQRPEKASIRKMKVEALHPEARASRKALNWAYFPGVGKARNLVRAWKGQGKWCNWNQRTKQWLKPPRVSILKALAFTLSEIRGPEDFKRSDRMTFKEICTNTKISCLELAKLSPTFQEFTMKEHLKHPRMGHTRNPQLPKQWLTWTSCDSGTLAANQISCRDQ